MEPFPVWLLLVVLAIAGVHVTTGQNTRGCVKDGTAIWKEGRTCRTLCSNTRPCRNPRAVCLCDGPCGTVCIPPDISCDLPASPPNGKVQQNIAGKVTFQSKIKYSCDAGFELVGSEERHCRGDEKWSGPEPFCTVPGVGCSVPTFKVENADDGTDGKTSFYLDQQVTYKCEVGFTMSPGATTTTTCVKTSSNKAEWRPEISLECIPITCETPESPENGEFEGDDFTFGRSVEYKCHDGYYLRGSYVRHCTHDGSWTGDVPECKAVECEKPESPTNGRVRHSSLDYLSTAWYECDGGYWLDGVDRRKCNAVGEWEGDEPLCKEIDCGPPPDVAADKSSKIRTQSYHTKLNGWVEYECEPLHSTSGTKRITCVQGDDKKPKWSLPPPICFKHCLLKNLPNAGFSKRPSNSRIHYRTEDLQHATKIRMECNYGYEVKLSYNSVSSYDLECDNGTWTPNYTCTPRPCQCTENKEMINTLSKRGMMLKSSCSEHVDSGQEVDLRCSTTYPELQPSGSPLKLRCSLGDWKYPPSSVLCIELSCTLTKKFQHGIISFKFGGHEIPQQTLVSHSSKLYFECTESGYELIEKSIVVEVATATCNNGSFTEFPFCKEARCSCNKLKADLRSKSVALENCPNNKYVESNAQTALVCAHGYSLPRGAMQSICEKGKWIEVKGNCKKKCLCSELELPNLSQALNCSKIQSKNSNETIQLSCSDPASPYEGNPKLTCNNGLWQQVDFLCHRTCSVPSIQNGKVLHQFRGPEVVQRPKSQVQSKQTVQVICDEDYILHFEHMQRMANLLLCDNGTWTQQIPLCKFDGCSCDDLRQQLKKKQLTTDCEGYVKRNTVVEVDCEEGFVKSAGSNKAGCRQQWTETDLLCTENSTNPEPLHLNPDFEPPASVSPVPHQTELPDVSQTVVRPTEGNRSVDNRPKENKKKNIENTLDPFGSTTHKFVNTGTTEPTVIDQETYNSEKLEQNIPGKNNAEQRHSCTYEEIYLVVAFYNGKKIEESRKKFSENTTISYRCIHIGKSVFSGNVTRTCRNGKWTGNQAECEELQERNVNKPPVIEYIVQGGNDEVLPNGTLLLDAGALLVFSCLWFSHRGNVTWTFNQQTELPGVSSWNTAKDKLLLEVSKLEKHHSGKYACTSPYNFTNTIEMLVYSSFSTTTSVTTPFPRSNSQLNQEQEAYQTTSGNSPHVDQNVQQETLKSCIITVDDNFLITAYGQTIRQSFSAFSGTEVRYYCIHDQKVWGSTRCLNGEWSHAKPHCPTRGTNQFPIQKKSCDYTSEEDRFTFTIYQGKIVYHESVESGAILRFRCQDVYTLALRGNSISECNDGQWTNPFPYCYSSENAPHVNLHSDEKTITDDGFLVIPRRDNIYIYCMAFYNPKVTMNNIEFRTSSFILVRKSPVRIWFTYKVFTANLETLNVTCTDRAFDTHNTRTIIIKLSSVCILSDFILIQKGVNAAEHTKRNVYIEGDTVMLTCRPESRGLLVPKAMTCSRNKLWTYAKQERC